ncbi:hypothetical protein, partial [Bifidobacterium breve]|uniref:hypothetical protein n=1 Tax=Bifidobacterium breve TaxID=1685 RepID=UPI001B7FE2E7
DSRQVCGLGKRADRVVKVILGSMSCSSCWRSYLPRERIFIGSHSPPPLSGRPFRSFKKKKEIEKEKHAQKHGKNK